MAPTNADSNLLFAVLALHADLIDRDQFVAACSEWCGRKESSLADILGQRGWLTSADRAMVERLVERKLHRHGGNARACLAEMTTDAVRHSLAGVDDPDLQQSLAGSTPLAEEHGLVTCDHVPESQGRYTLSRLHATGGIGRVWVARDSNIGRDVALKDLRPERAARPEIWARFIKEAQITGQLEHPGIVPIYEMGKHPADQSPFYTMRFVRGRTLKDALKAYHERRARSEAGPMELRDLLTAFVGVCNAVDYAHARGVLHRDLKPLNVVLGDYGEVVVLDWGMARLIGDKNADAVVVPDNGGGAQLTMQGQAVGTPAFMAPEQAEGLASQLSARTDVYGLGATLYTILAGRPPFTGSETKEVLRQVVAVPPARPRDLIPGTPPALEAVCLKALSKKPESRYASAKQVADEVRRWMADEPVQAYQDPWSVRLLRWGRRRRTLVVAAAVFLVVSVVALASSTALIWREQSRTEEQRIQAEAQRQRADEQRRQAEAQRQRAEENYAIARGLSFQVLEVFENKLAALSQTEPVRKELLDAALDAFKKFLAQRPDDQDIRKRTGQLYRYTANVRRLVGDGDNADRLYRESIRIQEALAAQAPGDRFYQSQLAETLRDFANLQGLRGQLRDAIDTLGRSVAISQGLVDAAPLRTDYQRLLALALLDRSAQEEARGLNAEASGTCQRAAALFQALVNGPKGKHALDRMFLGAAQTRLAICQRELGKPDDALQTHVEAIKQLKLMLDEGKDRTNGSHFLGRALVEESRTLATFPDRRQEAERDLDQAVLLWQGLIAQHTQIAFYQEWQAIAFQARGGLHVVLSRISPAREDLDKSRTIFEELVKSFPDIPAYSGHLGRTYAALARLALARGEAEKAAQYFGKSLDSLRSAVDRNPEHAADRRSLLEVQVEAKQLKS